MLSQAVFNQPEGDEVVDRFVNSLPVRILLVILTGLVAAGIAPIIFLANQIIISAVLKLAALFAVGIASGLAARFILNSSPTIVKWLVSGLATLASLVILFLSTNGYVGISFAPGSSILSIWNALYQLALAEFSTWLALQAWQAPNPSPLSQTKPGALPVKSHPRTKRSLGLIKIPHHSSLQHKTHKPGVPLKPARKKPGRKKTAPQITTTAIKFWREQIIHLDKSVKRVQPRLSQSLAGSQRWANSLLQEARRKLDSRKFRRGAQKRAAVNPASVYNPRPNRGLVHFSGAEEHRCPYCLEIVKRNDPRGIRICPVCHTYHHADCWAVTGTCQVPHQHE